MDNVFKCGNSLRQAFDVHGRVGLRPGAFGFPARGESFFATRIFRSSSAFGTAKEPPHEAIVSQNAKAQTA